MRQRNHLENMGLEGNIKMDIQELRLERGLDFYASE